MIQIEFIRTKEVFKPHTIDLWHKEDEVVRPKKKFKNMDEAWTWAREHGMNPFKNIKVKVVD